MSEPPSTPTSSNLENIVLMSHEKEPVNSTDLKKNKKKVEWSPENEKILVEWCDIAQCYKWLNNRAHHKFSKMHAYFTIPAIVLSTITGTASFAQANLPENYRAFAPMIIGTINIAVGILTTIQQYLKISELNEAHRVATIAWDKFARNIRIELAKAPDERPDAGIFLKYNRDEYDRLMETSPSIPENIINIFTKTFSVENQTDPERQRLFKQLKRPDICDIIISAEENRHHWYKELEVISGATEFEEKMEKDLLKFNENLRAKEIELLKKEEELRTKAEHEIEEKTKMINEVQEKQNKLTREIENYMKLFRNAQGRSPSEDEVLEKFQEEDENMVKLILSDIIINEV